MFPGSVIRKLAHSEEVFAQYEVFTAITVQLRGLVDVDAMAEAFDAVVAAHPVLSSHLEPNSDGGWNLVADDMLHPGIWLVDGDNAMRPGNDALRLDQSVSLWNLRLMLGEEGPS
jgi:hypothetical protein